MSALSLPVKNQPHAARGFTHDSPLERVAGFGYHDIELANGRSAVDLYLNPPRARARARAKSPTPATPPH